MASLPGPTSSAPAENEFSLVALCEGSVTCAVGCIHQRCEDDCLVQHVDITPDNPAVCRPTDTFVTTSPTVVAQEDSHHKHGLTCGHELVQHGDHLDFLVDSHLHHLHGNHYDDHGAVDLDTLLWFDICHCAPGSAGHHDSEEQLHNMSEMTVVKFAVPADNKSLPPSSCSNCKKVVLPVTHRTDLTKENAKRKQEALSELIDKLVKPRSQGNFSLSSPVHHLKGLTSDFATRLKEAVRETFGKECVTVKQLASLSDEEIVTIKARDPTGFRNLPSLHVNVRELAENAGEEVNFRKRAQNAACCHRFRERKKQKLAALEQTLGETTAQCKQLMQRITELERERDFLKEQVNHPQHYHHHNHDHGLIEGLLTQEEGRK